MSINKRIKNIYIDTELVLPMYNMHPYFYLKNLGKKCSLHMAKYGRYLTAMLFLQCWAPSWFTFLLAPLRVLLWVPLTLFSWVIVVLGREAGRKRSTHPVVWARSAIIIKWLFLIMKYSFSRILLVFVFSFMSTFSTVNFTYL